MLITQLVRIAGRQSAVRATERLLGMGLVSDEDLKRLQTHFEAERAENLLLVGIRGERALSHRLMENLESRRLPVVNLLAQTAGNPNSEPDLMLRASSILYQFRLYEDHAAFLRRLNQACEIARLPPRNNWQGGQVSI
jgi:hypothetical protein